MKVTLVINTDACCRRFAPKFTEAQRFLDSEVLRGCAEFVPMRTGNLMRSGNLGTVIGSGKVIYNAPYAKKCYYGRHLNFTRTPDKHPKAQAFWLEPAKAAHMDEWTEGVAKIVRGSE